MLEEYSEQLTYIKDLNNTLWYWFSYYTMIPMWCMTIWKLYRPVDFDSLPRKWYLVKLKEDKIIILLTFYSIIYYIIDSIWIIITGNLFNGCYLSYFIHHVFALSFIPFVTFFNYMPWFILFPGAFHTILLIFPAYKSLNYAYLLVGFLTHYGCLKSPLKDIPSVKILAKAIPGMYLSFGLLWFYKCSNTMNIISI